MVQRKYRNAEERVAICNEIKANMDKANLRPTMFPSLQPFFTTMETFANATDGRTFQGVEKLSDLNLQIEYHLPGRRLLPHYARITKLTEQS
jgi:hypothetical protein